MSKFFKSAGAVGWAVRKAAKAGSRVSGGAPGVEAVFMQAAGKAGRTPVGPYGKVGLTGLRREVARGTVRAGQVSARPARNIIKPSNIVRPEPSLYGNLGASKVDIGSKYVPNAHSQKVVNELRYPGRATTGPPKADIGSKYRPSKQPHARKVQLEKQRRNTLGKPTLQQPIKNVIEDATAPLRTPELKAGLAASASGTAGAFKDLGAYHAKNIQSGTKTFGRRAKKGAKYTLGAGAGLYAFNRLTD